MGGDLFLHILAVLCRWSFAAANKIDSRFFFSHPVIFVAMFVVVAAAVAIAVAAGTSRYPFRDAPLAKAPAVKFAAPIATTPGIDGREIADGDLERLRMITLLEKQRELEEWKQVHLARVDVEKRILTPNPWAGIWEAWEAEPWFDTK